MAGCHESPPGCGSSNIWTGRVPRDRDRTSLAIPYSLMARHQGWAGGKRWQQS